MQLRPLSRYWPILRAIVGGVALSIVFNAPAAATEESVIVVLEGDGASIRLRNIQDKPLLDQKWRAIWFYPTGAPTGESNTRRKIDRAIQRTQSNLSPEGHGAITNQTSVIIGHSAGRKNKRYYVGWQYTNNAFLPDSSSTLPPYLENLINRMLLNKRPIHATNLNSDDPQSDLFINSRIDSTSRQLVLTAGSKPSSPKFELTTFHNTGTAEHPYYRLTPAPDTYWQPRSIRHPQKVSHWRNQPAPATERYTRQTNSQLTVLTARLAEIQVSNPIAPLRQPQTQPSIDHITQRITSINLSAPQQKNHTGSSLDPPSDCRETQRYVFVEATESNDETEDVFFDMAGGNLSQAHPTTPQTQSQDFTLSTQGASHTLRTQYDSWHFSSQPASQPIPSAVATTQPKQRHRPPLTEPEQTMQLSNGRSSQADIFDSSTIFIQSGAGTQDGNHRRGQYTSQQNTLNFSTKFVQSGVASRHGNRWQRPLVPGHRTQQHYSSQLLPSAHLPGTAWNHKLSPTPLTETLPSHHLSQPIIPNAQHNSSRHPRHYTPPQQGTRLGKLPQHTLIHDELAVPNDQQLTDMGVLRYRGTGYWQHIQQLGAGNYSNVDLMSRPDKDSVVVKKIDLSNKKHWLYYREAAILHKILHDNIVTLKGFAKVDTRSGPEIWLVMEYEPNTIDLGKFINQYTTPPSEEVIRTIMADVVSGMAFLHANDIVHRDIKPNNILVSTTKETGSQHIFYTAKISDFGFAAIQLSGERLSKTYPGSATYAPLELFEPSPAPPYNGKAHDIFSFGATAFHAFTRREPYDWIPAQTSREFVKLRRSGRYKELDDPEILDDLAGTASPHAINTILQCTAKDPSDRICADDLTNDDWFTLPISRPANAQGERNQVAPHIPRYENSVPTIDQLRLGGLQLTTPLANHKEEKILLKGEFSEVYLYSRSDSPSRKIVIKSVLRGSKNERLLLREAGILQHLHHQHILKARGITTYSQNQQAWIALVLDYIPGQDMCDLLNDRPDIFNEKLIQSIIRKVALAIQHMHRRNIAHRDIKPENILITLNGDNQVIQLKVADFGLAIFTGDTPYSQDNVGSHAYAAPEIYAIPPKQKYTPATDIWSIGATTYVGFTRTEPYPADESDIELYRQQHQNDDLGSEFKLNAMQTVQPVSPAAKDFVRKCCHLQPCFRPTIDQALELPWLATTSQFKNP